MAVRAILPRPEGRGLPRDWIKSSETFTRDFLRGLEHFRTLSLPRSGGGLVLCNGAQEFETEGLRVLNPFGRDTDLWNLVTADSSPPGPLATHFRQEDSPTLRIPCPSPQCFPREMINRRAPCIMDQGVRS